MTSSKLSNQIEINDDIQFKSIEASASLTTTTTTTKTATASTVSNATNNTLIKIKNYRVKNFDWFCKSCDIYCNSQSQFDVHLISQKHKLVLHGDVSLDVNTDSNEIGNVEENGSENIDCQLKREVIGDSQSQPTVLDENNNHTLIKNMNSTEEKKNEGQENVRDPKADYSISQFHGIKAEHYLIPESKKKGKFEKFGFYCSLCDAYMTGQIQLVMHVKGAKHQYYSPNEIPGYVPTKLFNPNYGNKMRYTNLHIAQASTNVTITNTRLQMNQKFKFVNSHPAYNGLMFKSQPGYMHSQAYSNLNFPHHLQPTAPTPPTGTPIYQCNYTKSLSHMNKTCPPNPFIQQHAFLGVATNASPVFPSNYPPLIQSTPNTMMNFSYNKLRLNTNTISLTSVNRIDRTVQSVPCTHHSENINENDANINTQNSTSCKANNSNESLLNKSFETNVGFYDTQVNLTNTSGMSANRSQVQAQHQQQQTLYNGCQVNNNSNRSSILPQTQLQHHLPHLNHQQSQGQAHSQPQQQQIIQLQTHQQQHQQNQSSQQRTLLHPCQMSMNQAHYFTNNLPPNSNSTGRLVMFNSHSKPIENQNNNLCNNIQASNVHQQAYFRHY